MDNIASLPLDTLSNTDDYLTVIMLDNSYAKYFKFANRLTIKIKIGKFKYHYFLMENDKEIKLFVIKSSVATIFETNADTIGELCNWFLNNPDISQDSEFIFADCKSRICKRALQ